MLIKSLYRKICGLDTSIRIHKKPVNSAFLNICSTRIVVKKSIKSVIHILLFFFALIVSPIAKAANILAIPPTPDLKIVLGTAWNIYITGSLERGDAQKLAALIEKNRIPIWSTVIFDSPGGNLYEAMEIGRLIRKNRFATNVGKRKSLTSEPDDVSAAGCFSACTIAFVGGTFRYLVNGSIYGVHRFSSAMKTDFDLDLAQMISADVVAYLREMDVDVDLFVIMTKSSPREISELSIADLKKMNILNYGFERPKWSIESTGDNIYLKGERNTANGINKFLLICASPRQILIHAIFDPQGHEEESISMQSYSLMVNGKQFPLVLYRKEIINGWFNALFILNLQQAKKLRDAMSVGIAVQFAPEAPTFLGFDAMPVGDGEQKLKGFLHACGV